jgi:hypothetical protein
MRKFDADRDIVFKLDGQCRKTNIYKVWNVFSECLVGIVSWDICWRQYVFAPYSKKKFSYRCMMRIADFLLDMNEDHYSLKGKNLSSSNTIKK